MISGKPQGDAELDLQPAVVEKTPIIGPTPLEVDVIREMSLDWFTIQLPNGHSEELDPDDTRRWFRERGANMVLVERALDHAWNFGTVRITIANPRRPVIADQSVRPDIGDGIFSN